VRRAGQRAALAAVLLAAVSPALAASFRFVTEYRYPTAFEVIPVMGADAFL